MQSPQLIRSLAFASLAAILIWFGICEAACGQGPIAPPTLLEPSQSKTVERPAASAIPPANSESNVFQELATQLVRENLPLEYEDLKDWGGTKDIVSGLSVRREGLKIETRRTRSEVNHGTWKLYRIQLLDPSETFQLRVEDIHESEDGRIAFDVTLASRLRLFGRVSHWQTGVQLASISADAEATATLRMHCLLRARLDVGAFPPDVVFEPHVETATIDVQDFRVRRVSQLHGPLVREMSASVREILESQLEKKRPQLPDRINRAIDKRKDRLRLSTSDLLKSEWGSVASQFLNLTPPSQKQDEAR